MTEIRATSPNDPRFAPEHFTPGSLEDEIRIDRLCVELLQTFCRASVAAGCDPLRTGALARGADYFLREFIIDNRRDNLFFLPLGRVRQFAANWYIINTLEPNRSELAEILEGVEAFYRFCCEHDKVTEACYRQVAAECTDLDYYEARIESFWNIRDDGYLAWDAACPLIQPQETDHGAG